MVWYGMVWYGMVWYVYIYIYTQIYIYVQIPLMNLCVSSLAAMTGLPLAKLYQVATDSISVHAHELVLSAASFTPSQGSVCQSDSITLRTKAKTAVIGFEEVLPVGKGGIRQIPTEHDGENSDTLWSTNVSMERSTIFDG